MANKQIRYGIGFDVDSSGLNTLRQQLQSLQKDIGLSDFKPINKERTLNDLNEVKRVIGTVGDALELAFNPKLNAVNVQEFQKHLSSAGLSVKDISKSFMDMGVKGEQAFRNLTLQVLNTKQEVKSTSKLLDSMASTLGNTIKWSIASTAINTVTGAIQKAWGFTKQLDESLNDIRIVTGQSAEQMDKFADKANKAAKALGANTTAYTKAALIYYQQGLGETDVQARTEATVKAANVTGQSASEVSEQLTAVWNGYKVVAEEAELYVDKLAAVAATTAADLEELSDGMSKVASAANTMGVDIDQLSAQLSTIVSVTRQDASAVGTALKTIFARMGDLKVDGVDEFGTSLGDVSGQMKQMGIDVLDQQGNLRNMGEVIEEVAEKWSTWTDAQQQAAAVAMAGKRQYNNLIALFENWDMYESALGTSRDSVGTLQKQQDTYMDSLEGHLNQLSVAGERVYKAFFDSESMKDMIDLLTGAVDLFANFTEAIGGGGNMLLMLGSVATRVFNVQIANGLTNFVNNLRVAKINAINLQAEMAVLDQFGAEIQNHGEAYKKLLDMKRQELEMSRYLTEEERERARIMINNANQIETNKENEKEQAKTIQNSLRRITGKEGLTLQEDGVDHIDMVDEEKKKINIDSDKKLAEQREKEKNVRQENSKKIREDSEKIRELEKERTAFQKEIEARQSNRSFLAENGDKEYYDKNEKAITEAINKEKQLAVRIDNLKKIRNERQAKITAEVEATKKIERDRGKQIAAVDLNKIDLAKGSEIFTTAAEKSREISGDIKTLNLNKANTDLDPMNEDLKKTQKALYSKGYKKEQLQKEGFVESEIESLESQENLSDKDQKKLDFLKQYAEKLKEIKEIEKERLAVQATQDEIDSIANGSNTNFDEDSISKLTSLNIEYEDVLKKVRDGESLNAQELRRYNKYRVEASNIIDDNTERLEKNAEASKDLAFQGKNTANQGDKLNKSWKDMFKGINTKKAIAGMVNLAGSIGQVSSGVMSCVNAFKVLGDDSLSTGEKMLQFFMSMGTAIPMVATSIGQVIGSFGKMGTSIKTTTAAWALLTGVKKLDNSEDQKKILISAAKLLGIQLEDEELKKLTATELKQKIVESLSNSTGLVGLVIKAAKLLATKKQTQANVELAVAEYGTLPPMWAIIAVIAIAIAAIAALVAIIYGLIKAFEAIGDNGKKNFEEASKAAKTAAEEFNKAKEAYENLKKSFEEINSAEKAISTMIKGTQEWEEAVQSLNNKVIDLIDKYPQLAQYVETSEDGILSISKDGQETLLENQRDLVSKTNSTKISTNVQKLRAKNEMLKEEGKANFDNSEKLLKTALGQAVSGNLIGAIVNASVGLSREDAYKNALEAVEKYGDSIFKSQDAFTKAMEKQGDITDKQIEELWKHRKELKLNADEIKANTSAIEALNKQQAQEDLNNEDFYKDASENEKDLMSNYYSNALEKEIEDEKDRLKKELRTGNSINKTEAKRVFKKYAAATGIDYIGDDFDYDYKTNTLTYVNSATGEEQTVNADYMMNFLATEGAKKKTKEDSKKAVEAYKTMSSKLGVSKGIVNLIGGKESGDLSDLTQTEISDLGAKAFSSEEKEREKEAAYRDYVKGLNSSDPNVRAQAYRKYQDVLKEIDAKAYTSLGFSSQEELDAEAKKLGYDSGQAYLDAIQASVDNYEIASNNLLSGLNDSVTFAFENIELKDGVTLKLKKQIIDSLNSAYESAGPEAVNALQNLFNSIDDKLTKEDFEKLTAITKNIDWQAPNSVIEFNKAIEASGIILSGEAKKALESFTDSMESFQNHLKVVLNDLTSAAESLSTLVSITKDLHLGDVISKEDYETLIAFNSALKDYFVITATGYKYTGGGESEIQKAKNGILDPAKIINQAQDVKAATMFNRDEYGDSYTEDAFFKSGISDTQDRAAHLAGLAGYGSSEAVFEHAGTTQMEIQEAYNTVAGIGNQGWQIAIKDKNGKTQRPFTGMSFRAITNLSKDSIKSTLANYGVAQDKLDSTADDVKNWAEEGIKKAEELIDKTYNEINSVNNQIESGTFDKSTARGVATALSGKYLNYDQLTNSSDWTDYVVNTEAGDEVSSEVQKLAKVYLAEEAVQLGINAKAWEKYIESQNPNLETQDKLLANWAKMNTYLNSSPFAQIENSLDKLNREYNELNENQDKYIKGSSKATENLESQIEKQQKIIIQEQNRKDKLEGDDGILATMRSSINGIIPGAFDASGNVNWDTYQAIYSAMLSAGTQEERDRYKFYLDQLDAFVDKQGELDDSADAIKEAYQETLDLQIQKYQAKIEIRLDLEEAKQEWFDFREKYIRASESSIFEDAKALDIINVYSEKISQNSINAAAALSDLQNLSKDDFTVDGKLDEAAYLEQYKTNLDTLVGKYDELYESVKTLYDTYNKLQEEIIELYDKQITRLENINTLIQGQIGLNKLLNNSVDTKLYNDIIGYTLNSYDIAVQKAITAAEEYKKAFDEKGIQLVSDEQLAMLEENLYSAQEAVISMSQQVVDTILDQTIEKFKVGIDNVLKSSTGKDFDYLSTQWELAQANDERYIDEVNAEYEIGKLERNIQKSIDETESLSAQSKLNDLKQRELDILKEKGKLTQYDLDQANAMYDLTLKQIALEEAQQTANKMKLTRDAMGNYTYQYVADEDKIAQAEADLAAAENKLYNLNKDEAKERISEVFSLMTEGYEKWAELKKQGRDEEAEMVYKEYFGESGLIAGLTGSFETVEENMKKLGLTFDGTSIGQTFNELAKVDFEKFGTELSSAYSEANAYLETFEAELETYLGKNSPLVTSITNLTSAFTNGVTLDENGKLINVKGVSDRTSQTEAVITQISLGEETLKSLATSVSGVMEKYVNALSIKDITGLTLTDNTEALNNNTLALIRFADQMDRNLDGKIGDTVITYNGYKFEDGDWVQIAQDTTDGK